jgi:hypothetical protein
VPLGGQAAGTPPSGRSSAGRTVPGLRDRTLSEDEAGIVHRNVAKVRVTLDWIECVVRAVAVAGS